MMIGKFSNAKVRKTKQREKPIYIFLDITERLFSSSVFPFMCTITSV